MDDKADDENTPSGEADIVVVAATILSELERSPEEGIPVGPLADLVRRAREETGPEARLDREDELYALLAAHEPTRRRMDQLLPADTGREKGLESTYPPPAPVLKDRYVCPVDNGYTWAVLSVEDPRPPLQYCPDHPDVALVFRAAGVEG
jgi:hypothetical protein